MISGEPSCFSFLLCFYLKANFMFKEKLESTTKHPGSKYWVPPLGTSCVIGVLSFGLAKNIKGLLLTVMVSLIFQSKITWKLETESLRYFCAHVCPEGMSEGDCLDVL